MKTRRFLLTVFLAVMLATLGFGCGQPPPTNNPVQSMDVDRFGQMISAEGFNGLVAVFASWCPPCREELPDLAKLYRSAKPDAVQIIAVSLENGDAQPVQRLVDRLELPFPVYHVGRSLASRYQIAGVPTLLVVQRGRIVEKIPGQLASGQLADKLKRFGAEGS